MRLLLLAWLLAGPLLAWTARAGEVDPEPARQAEARAEALLAGGQAEDAARELKAALQTEPGSVRLRWWLARAYLAAGNDAWAMRTLAELAELAPEDCEPSLWLAWILMRQGALEEAAEALQGAACREASPAAARSSLLAVMLARHAGRAEEARLRLTEARGAAVAHAEDRAALEQLTRELEPARIVPLSARLELQTGFAANARAGSPLDPAAAGEDTSSPVEQASLWLRFVAPTGRWLRPSMELEGRATAYVDTAVRDLSFVQVAVRPGLLLGPGEPRALVAYRGEGLVLSGGDRYDPGPNLFYLGHRAELDVELLPSLSLFAGAGRRLFRELGRSRTEVDGGLGGGLEAGSQLRLLGAVSARYHAADKAPYDLWGMSLLVSAELHLPERYGLRFGALLAFDDYPHSAGYFDASRPNEDRRELALRLSATAWSPPLLPGLKVGLGYEYAERLSTAEPYDYRDHRGLVKLVWTFSFDPWLPAGAGTDRLRELEHGLESAELEDRIQDLLRQDEAAQRSSSCVE
jgi:hypothetical protein